MLLSVASDGDIKELMASTAVPVSTKVTKIRCQCLERWRKSRVDFKYLVLRKFKPIHFTKYRFNTM